MIPSSRRSILLLALCASVLLAGAPRAETGAETGAPMADRLAVAEGVAGHEGAAAFYRERGFAPIWTAGDAASDARLAALLGALSRAPDHGLPGARWDVEGLRARLASVRTGREAAAAEAALTAAYLDYARALSSGLLDPREVAPNMVREVARPEAAALLGRILGDDPAGALRDLVPDSPEYGRLMRHRAGIERAIAAGGWGPPVEGGILRPGESGPRVVALRDRLRAMGLMGRSLSPAYDEALAEAVGTFQARAGLAADGVAGPATLAALNVPPEARLGQVLVAMERERWLDRDRGGRHIWVNLPDFTAAIVDDGEVSFLTDAVIGLDEAARETPEFSDVMDHLVVNPSWYVPRSIAVGEYLPQLQRNPRALGHMEITDSRGRAVDRSRGFSQYTARTFPFAMRQPPGPKNALGSVKFMFPNRHNIYLHDTPQRHLFARERRAFSHGCIRLAEPAAFAHALLARQEDDPEGAFARLRRSGREARVNLEAPVPVHLVYRTAFTDALGAIHWREDVYGRDAAVLDALLAAGVEIGAGAGA